MQEWFKYEYGYVNIDDEYLYLTNSGNWSETFNLQEKSRVVNNRNENKSAWMIGFLVVVFAFFAFLILMTGANGKISFTLLFLTIGGGYKMYEYMKRGIGAKFKIPLPKISEIRMTDDLAEIAFTDGEGNSEVYKLLKVDEKGRGILQSLNDNLAAKKS